jgi:hypothetical protein
MLQGMGVFVFLTLFAMFLVLSDTVLSPFLPDGSSFLLRFSTKEAGGGGGGGDGNMTPSYYHRIAAGPPDSPSAAPSPYPSSTDLKRLDLNANQLALLGARLKGLQTSYPESYDPSSSSSAKPKRLRSTIVHKKETNGDNANATGGETENKLDSSFNIKMDDADDSNLPSTEDPIQARLLQITELLLEERTNQKIPIQEKRQVVFVLANYFVLFLAMIAMSAEIQARAPQWHASLEQHYQKVQNCAADQDALFDCVSNGDFAGLIASVVLWISKSATTKRVFLFGFETPNKLWAVVYESLVTAICWGVSYMFIRRGMNPDTNHNFLQKYWKDAVYGSLAGFNAAFMKHVLKNLIPKEAIEVALQDALHDRQLKILSWFQR